MKKVFNFKLLMLIGVLMISLTPQAWAGNSVYIQLQGTNSGEPHEANAVPYVASATTGWSSTKTTIIDESSGWGYVDMPDNGFDIYRGNNSGSCWNKLIYVDQGAGIYYIYKQNGTVKSSRVTDWRAGWENADPNNNRWVKVGANGSDHTAKSTDSDYDKNIGTTVNLYLKEFGAWTWKYNNKDGQYGNVGSLTLNFRLGKDGSGDMGNWAERTTSTLGTGENTKNNITYQPWKWTGNLDLLDFLTTKTSLTSGTYYIKYYWSAQVNRATGHTLCPETIYFSRNSANYFIHFTIPTPEVKFDGRPYAGISSRIDVEPKSGTTISGQTFQYQFEETTNNGSSWTVVQAYSSTAQYTYTPANTSNKIRVKMKVVETNEESGYVVVPVYEQYFIYVEDSQNWGQMWETMKNTDYNTYHLGRGFPGEKLLPCDTVDGKPIYRITLDTYFHRLWLSVGDNTKQTFAAGFPINYDDLPTYGIKKEHAGHWFQIVQGSGGANDCYLKDYSKAVFRVVSYDGATGKTYYSNAISPTETTGTVSFFANPANASSYVKIQTWSQGGTGTGAQTVDGTWNTGSTNYKTSCFSVSATGTVFTATLTSSSLSNVAKYTGDYDIHVYANTKNNLDGGMAKGGVGTKFTYFDPNPTIFGTEDYNHYWVDWFAGADISVVATVGNKYNSDLANVISTDPYAPYGQTTGDGANVRYGYKPETNYFSRTMIAGSGNEIKIQGTNVNPNSAGWDAQSSFTDASDWVYTAGAIVKGQATATVTTSYNGYAQTLEADQKLLNGETSSNYDVVITYDYKTNRLLAAWKPTGSFDGFDLQSNLLLVRQENGKATVLNIIDGSDAGSEKNDLTNITKIYTALEVTRANWIKSGGNADRRITSGIYRDEYYWISLPYNCKINEIFGIEGYGTSWVIQTYHGDYRARDGWWAETSSWWYNMDRDGIMEANRGYVIRFTNLNGEGSLPKRFVDEVDSKLTLYFPSSENNVSLGVLTGTVQTHLDEMKCTKWNKNNSEPNQGENNPTWDRRAIDSNWRIIGSPSFNSAKISAPTFPTGTYPTSPSGYDLKYFYTWTVESNKGKYTISSATNYEFQATRAYLVQYAGDITWSPKSANTEDAIVGLKAPARYQEEEVGDPTYELVITKDGAQEDVAYITRMKEGATEGYDLNLDLSKLINKNCTNLYTWAGAYRMAGNCLPDDIATVPVGVQIATTGEYTFAIPAGTNGVGVTLVDNVTGARTNLGLTEYTTELENGSYDGRFVLELSPIAQTPTDVENMANEESTARKVMIDGTMYIVRSGKVFDARGSRVE